ncbi:DNA-protecting protein DprA [Catenovulum sp. SM1970]|uniref:DNA-processing protein DprA n=1 Tax=Marinifaba aquimaris TaxID=2741323 RepID=UPI0015729D1E|nr:DNA-processing protein DprA [Marinifaba aquimaris]NTS78652.1 DNA-protecting protein DprA [Marinifaba aquimaris]
MDEVKKLSEWLQLSQVKYLKYQDLQTLLSQYSTTELCQMSSHELTALGLSKKQAQQLAKPNQQQIEHLINWQSMSDNYILHWQHPLYPSLLKEIAAAPKVLFCRGNIELLATQQMALVGSRNASHYGLDNAFEFAADLASRGFTITSGFASGIDGKAHQGALSVEGNTIAVLGTGVDIVYPKRHINMANQIAESGLLISEFEPGTGPKAQHFPRRNRIISGLSLGVLVVEAAIKSGSLITARYALEQNKEVYAIPSSIHDPKSRGCHMLIKQGAKLVETTADILEEIRNWTNPQAAFNFSSEASQNFQQKKSLQDFTSDPLLGSLSFEVTSVDTLVARSQLPIDVILSRLLELELQGLIAAVSGGYVRTRRDEYV